MEDVVYQVEQKPLPEVLTRLREFRNLSDEQSRSLLTRIRFIQEFSQKLQEVHEEDVNELRDALDDLELDAAICLSVSGDARTRVSPWLVHSSWTSHVSTEELSDWLPREVRRLMAAPSPGASCSREEFVTWVDSHRQLLILMLDSFFGASTLAQCLASFIGMNMIIAKLLSGLIEARFNDRL